MKPFWIVNEVLTESLFLLILGMLIGNALGFLSIFALSGKGIDLSSLAEGVDFFGMSRVIYPKVSGHDVLMANLVV
ncbi:MAG: ABC transporter permease, partial [Deltaproteobacteria bacterium]|nr:ABC transporter permease [Deltaproteobacteria bacterium]